MENSRLNHDILLAILGLCDRASAAALMRTCQSMYAEGAEYVLAGEVRIARSEDLLSLLLFLSMSGKDTSRFRFLQRLTLSVGLIDEELAFILRGAFRRMSHLHTLTIYRAEKLLRSRDDLRVAIARIQSLRHLEIRGAEKLACKLVKNLRVGLKSLRLRYSQYARHEDDDVTVPFFFTVNREELWSYHPIKVCKQIASTLEELDIEWGEGRHFRPSDHSTVYPHVRRLVLEEDFPWASPYIRKFPNLTHLSVTSNDPVDHRFARRVERYLICRQRNATEHLNSQAWKNLQEYEGQLLGLYLLAPIRRIPRLIFSSTVDRWTIALLGEVLNSANPSYLDIDFSGSPLGSSAHDMPTLLRGPGCASLESLKMAITLDRKDRNSDIGLCMDALLGSLALLPLSSLHLTVEAGPWVNPTQPLIETDPEDPDGIVINHVPYPLVLAERSLDEFEPLAYARKVADSVPSIQDVTIRVRGPRGKKERKACLRRDDGTKDMAML